MINYFYTVNYKLHAEKAVRGPKSDFSSDIAISESDNCDWPNKSTETIEKTSLLFLLSPWAFFSVLFSLAIYSPERIFLSSSEIVLFLYLGFSSQVRGFRFLFLLLHAFEDFWFLMEFWENRSLIFLGNWAGPCSCIPFDSFSMQSLFLSILDFIHNFWIS